MKKKPASKSAKKKTVPSARKTNAKAKPGAKARSRTAASAPAPARTSAVATYTPPTIQGTGWAPFRYPPQ